MLQRWGISIIYLRLARIDVFKYIIYMWNHLHHFNLVSNFIQPLIFQHNNFFYGFFCLIRSDGFWGFNSFVVLMEVDVGLVRYQKKRSSYLDVQIASKKKSCSEFVSCSCNFSSENATGWCQEQEEQGRKLLSLLNNTIRWPSNYKYDALTSELSGLT